MLFFGGDLVIVVGAVFSLVSCMFPFRVRMEFFTKKRKKNLQCCLWVSSDALSHLKINSEVRNASLLPFSALSCLCSVHDILHWVSCTVTQQWICLGVSWEEIQSLHISFMPSLYS